MTQIDPYINFNGQCREAMEFYKQCLGGELMMQPVEGSPVEEQCAPAMKNMVLHASLVNDGILIMGSDMGPGGYVQGNNMALSLNCSSEEEIKRFFTHLSEGGKVIHPLSDSFWGSVFGVITDKFGIGWMFNYQKTKN